MGNWRFGAFPKLPYSTMQQLNLDWILDRIRRFLPDNGTKGQVLTRTKDGAAWVDPEAASGAVSSVNGKTGAVVLTASDVGALPSSYQAPVTSVNGMTGDVVISGGGAVDSVNGQTGEVVLTAADVGALPSSTVIPDSTSDLINDSGFITAAQAAAAAPVQSVNGQTGSVVLGKSDVGLPNVDNVKQYSANNPPSIYRVGIIQYTLGSTIQIPELPIKNETYAVLVYFRWSTANYLPLMPTGTDIPAGTQNFTLNFAWDTNNKELKSSGTVDLYVYFIK